MIALSTWWYVGWAIGGVVVLIAAVLLLTIIGLGRRVVRQAGEISEALDGARANTAPLYEVKNTNLAISRITAGLTTARESLGK